MSTYNVFFTLQSLAAHCHTLRHLYILGGGLITDRGLKYLALENRKLRSIRLDSM